MPAAKTPATVVKANLAGKPSQIRETVAALRALVAAAAPDASEAVNPWGLLTFTANRPLASLLFAARHVSLVFSRGASLPDPAGLLEGTGKNLRHVKLCAPADVTRPELAALIGAAVDLNRREPPSTMGGAKRKSPPAKSARKSKAGP